MKTWLMAGTGLVLLAGGVAVAQQPPGPPPGPPAGGPAMERGMPPGPGEQGPGDRGPGEHGMRGGWRGGMMRMHPMPPPSKAAHFRFRKGDAMVDIRCPENEPVKACVDAGSALLDKLAAQK